ncbi:unnamed protein product [Kuraishia capsulata CBS 1993]|uniref:Uncharacterized protein n=1 Tax=Kuraishia capsulata CBS 1993 TaxID=1382522 RepID=W6MRJ1_9ASCO|nr:uncharacterized protein KUCA_T00005359001 [Kuraishia capsulata CBS 1993]CDK29371.1 unnamed protein product [Kuraishia capsulata CBS 1993]
MRISSQCVTSCFIPYAIIHGAVFFTPGPPTFPCPGARPLQMQCTLQSLKPLTFTTSHHQTCSQLAPGSVSAEGKERSTRQDFEPEAKYFAEAPAAIPVPPVAGAFDPALDTGSFVWPSSSGPGKASAELGSGSGALELPEAATVFVGRFSPSLEPGSGSCASRSARPDTGGWCGCA